MMGNTTNICFLKIMLLRLECEKVFCYSPFILHIAIVEIKLIKQICFLFFVHLEITRDVGIV